MRNELIEKSSPTEPDGNLINVVQTESKHECLQRYERPFYDAERGEGPNGWYNMLIKLPVLFNKEQFAVFRAVHQWRDNLARQEDESIHIVMSKNVMLSVSTEMPLDMTSLLACSHPISSLMRSNATELLGVIKEAKARGVNGPDMKDFLNSHPAKNQASTNDANRHTYQTTSRSESVPVLQALPLSLADTSFRTDISKFWGCTVGHESSRQTDHNISGRQNREIRLAIPLPQLTAEIMHNGLNINKADINMSYTKPARSAEHQYVRDRKPAEKNIFVIKELGGSRKRKATDLEGAVTKSSTPTAQNEDCSEDLSAANYDQGKAQRKAERKAQKRLEKEEQKRQVTERRNGGVEGTNNGEVEEPFDYAKAPSVLYAKHDKSDKVGSQRSFDPYVKSMDAPKGMRKSQKEISGRSHTFKS